MIAFKENKKRCNLFFKLISGNKNNIKFLKSFYKFFISLAFLLMISVALFDSFKKNDVYSQELALLSANELQRLFRDNEILLSFIGTLIQTSSSENFLESVDNILTMTPELAFSSLMAGYVCFARTDGTIIVSGKRGIIKNPHKNIKSRRYFETRFKNPWKLQFSDPNKSLCGDKYILPIAMGVTDQHNNIIGFLVTGPQINKIYQILDKQNLKIGYEIHIYDSEKNKYIPRYNPEENLFLKSSNEDFLKFSLKKFPYEVHIQKYPFIIFFDQIKNNMTYLSVLFILLFIIIFQNSFLVNRCVIKLKRLSRILLDIESGKKPQFNIGREQYILKEILEVKNIFESIISRHEKNKNELYFLRKNKELSAISLKKRESYFNDYFVRVEKNIEELDVCLNLIQNCSHDDKKTVFIKNINKLLSNIKNISYKKCNSKSFSFNSIVEESLSYYLNDFFEKDIALIKVLSKELPLIVGDDFFLKHFLICIFGRILENSYGLTRVLVRTRSLCSVENIFIITIEETFLESCGFVPIHQDEFLSKLRGSCIDFHVEKKSNKRTWLIKHTSSEINRDNEYNNSEPLLKVVINNID